MTLVLRRPWNRSVRRATCVALALALAATFGGPALAQLDTTAARDARQALHKLRQSYFGRPTWGPWAQYINVADVEFELRAGDRAETGALEHAVERLHEDGHATGPISKRLLEALEARVLELAPIPPAQWPANCYAKAKQHEPITAETVQQKRQALQDSLNELERRLPALKRLKDPWAVYLLWPETRSLITADTPDGALLDRLEARWKAAMTVWDSYELVEASFAVRSYVRLFRGYLANESPEQYAAAWDQLARLLESHAQSPQSDTAPIAAALNQRERLGQGTPTTAAIRRELSHPNIRLRLSTPWIESQLAEKINEPFNINEVYAGARTYGRGTLTATASCEVLPSFSVGQWIFNFAGTTQARGTGSSEGVTVTSRSTTKLSGSKPFTLDERGLTPGKATANASTSIVYESVNAPGRSRRRSEATSQAYGRRPQAEVEAAASARRFTLERLDKDGKDLADKFNKQYHEMVGERRFDSHRAPPDVRVRSAEGVLAWKCRLEGPDKFAAPGPPPTFAPQAKTVLSIAQSALEDQGLAMLGDRQMTAEQLAKAVSDLLGEPQQDDESAQSDFTADFAAHPCDVRLADGKVSVRLYINSFESADVQYPAMTVDTEYTVEPRGDDLALVRQGSVRVKPIAKEPGDAPLSGRQQTLRLAVQRKLNKAIAEEFLWVGPSLPSSEKDGRKLRVESAAVDGGWLQIALGEKAGS